jgi:hypothetical protein
VRYAPVNDLFHPAEALSTSLYTELGLGLKTRKERLIEENNGPWKKVTIYRRK